MQAKIISTLCASLICGTAYAQSNVSLYGVIDLGVAHFDNGAQSVSKLGTGMFVPSLIGLKGSEDLGGGLNAIFQVETGFCANGSATASNEYCTGGTFMGRTSIVGLKGGFGTVEAGRIYDLTHSDQVAVDPFQYGLLGSLDGPIGSLGAPGNLSQTLTYLSPDLNGFNLGATYVFGEGVTGTTTSSNSNGYNLHLGYQKGAVMLGADYLNLKALGVVTVKHTMLVGSYDFGPATVSGMYAQNSPDVASSNPKLKSYLLGLTVPVGAGAFLASYTKLKNDTQANANANQWALGYTYALSKQTNLYTSYSRISNQQAANYIVNDSTGNNDAPLAAPGFKSTGFIVGMMHSF